MRGVSRLRRVVVLLLCVVVVAVLAGVSLADPFHLRQARWFTTGLIAVALVLLTVLLATGAPRGPLRWVALVVGWPRCSAGPGSCTARARSPAAASRSPRPTTPSAGWSPSKETAAGRTRWCCARVAGPFEQESLVYQGVAGAPAPTARFVDPGTVEVAVGTCRYRSGVEAVTLAVQPVHRPLVLGC